MEPRLSLITLGVADVARSRRFYEALGWRASGASEAEVAFFQLGGIALSLWGRAELARDAVGTDRPGCAGMARAHNGGRGSEDDAIREEARLAVARILKPPTETVWGGYVGYFADPDDHLWEVAWNPHFPLDADGGLHLPPELAARRSAGTGS